MKVAKLVDANPMLEAFFKDAFDRTNKRIMSAARHGVSEAINRLKAKTKENIAGSWFNGTTSAGRTLRGMTYTVPLIEGVNAYMWKGQATGFVDIMGSRGYDSGLWRLRFFEWGTRNRKSKNGRSYGRIRPAYFFSNAYSSIGSDAIGYIQRAISQAIDEMNSSNK